jgi:hypothetical protein
MEVKRSKVKYITTPTTHPWDKQQTLWKGERGELTSFSHFWKKRKRLTTKRSRGRGNFAAKLTMEMCNEINAQ